MIIPDTITELFFRPARWTKDRAAHDKDGGTVEPDSEYATAFCLGAAIDVVYDGEGDEVRDRVRAWIAQHYPDSQGDISGWQDQPERTFKDIRRLVTELNI